MKKKVEYGQRIFSSMLIHCELPPLNEDNDIWRGKYNEDVDLSLRLLTQGFPTANFQNISSNKLQTGSCKGGNEKIYKEDAGDVKGGEVKTNEIVDRWMEIDVVKQETRLKYNGKRLAGAYIEKDNNKFNRVHHKINNNWIEIWEKENKLEEEEEMYEYEYDIYYK
tara:strand:- start:208 stop:705 length:498 start_codon:yes stop_codon:yes gene_type:complete